MNRVLDQNPIFTGVLTYHLTLASSILFQTNSKNKNPSIKLIEDAEYKIQEIDRLFNSESEKNISENFTYY